MDDWNQKYYYEVYISKILDGEYKCHSYNSYRNRNIDNCRAWSTYYVKISAYYDVYDEEYRSDYSSGFWHGLPEYSFYLSNEMQFGIAPTKIIGAKITNVWPGIREVTVSYNKSNSADGYQVEVWTANKKKYLPQI